MVFWAPPEATTARITEGEDMLFDGALPEAANGVRSVVLRRAARWRCDRVNREFAAATDTGETTSFAVRTPSCANRLVLRAPRRVEPGDEFTAEVRDTWGTGLTSARVCWRGECRQADLADGAASATTTFGAGARGRASAVLFTEHQRAVAPVAVGVKPAKRAASGPSILLTGDSMMQSVDTILTDRLARRARTISDVKVGTGLTSRSLGWPAYAKGQVRKHRPNATITFLGALDSAAMKTPAGDEVVCCGAGWVGEYARRAKQVMRTYAQDGASTVIWITVPAARDEDRHPSGLAVNRALARAAKDVPGTSLLHAEDLFTPGYEFRSHQTIGGRRVRVRQGDGIHLTLAGARLVATEVVRSLKALL